MIKTQTPEAPSDRADRLITEVEPQPAWQPPDDVDVFCRLIQSGIERWVEAGKLLCRALATDPQVFSKITNRVPYMTNDVLLAFQRIGEKKLYPYLLLDTSPSSRKMALLPYDRQMAIYGKPVKVAYRNIDGSYNSYEAAPHKLTKQEAEVVFSSTGVRSVEEQVKVLQREEPAPSTPKPTKPKLIQTPPVVEDAAVEAKRHLQAAAQSLSDAHSALERYAKPIKNQFGFITVALDAIRNLTKAIGNVSA